MTLRELRKKYPEAHSRWVEGMNALQLDEEIWRSRAYEVGKNLYLVWNNGCFYEPFVWNGKEWTSFTEIPVKMKSNNDWGRAKWYNQAGKTLSGVDRTTEYRKFVFKEAR